MEAGSEAGSAGKSYDNNISVADTLISANCAAEHQPQIMPPNSCQRAKARHLAPSPSAWLSRMARPLVDVDLEAGACGHTEPFKARLPAGRTPPV